MNTNDLPCLRDVEDETLERSVTCFVRAFGRLPRGDELARLRRARARLHLRIPAQGRRRLATLIAAL
jgi:hypothetical protein